MMYNYVYDELDRINRLLRQGAAERITDTEFVEREVNRFLNCQERKVMLDGVRYFTGVQDILSKKRTGIGKDGEIDELPNLPNHRIVDNQYRKAVLQKVNYLLGKPFTVESDDSNYTNNLNYIFDKKFRKIIKNVAKDCLNCGIGWLYVHYDENGELAFKRIEPWKVIPGWIDADHTELDYAIVTYDVIYYEGKTTEKKMRKVDVYTKTGIMHFDYDTYLVPCEKWHTDYIQYDGIGYNWNRIPLIPFKANDDELPLIKGVKSIQDGINEIESRYSDNMAEDSRNTILVLRNYDGEDLNEFRENLARYGAVKVSTIDGSDGAVETLNVIVDSENYKSILEMFKKALIENAMCYDAKDDRLTGNPNQMNIQSMYSDIDLDAANMETEFQASFEKLLFFVDNALITLGLGDYSSIDVRIIFNKNTIINEGEIIDDCIKSNGLLSQDTILARHPWVIDVEIEKEKLEQQQQSESESEYSTAFPNKVNDEGNSDEE